MHIEKGFFCCRRKIHKQKTKKMRSTRWEWKKHTAADLDFFSFSFSLCFMPDLCGKVNIFFISGLSCMAVAVGIIHFVLLTLYNDFYDAFFQYGSSI